MNSVILCEGCTDAVLIGKFLEANKQWKHSGKDKKGATLSKEDNKQIIDKYQRNDDWVYIWGVGGKTRFRSPLQKIFSMNRLNGALGFDNIIVIVDNDDEENDMIQEVSALFNITGLMSGEWKDVSYTDDFNLNYIVKLMVMIIPFEEKGALETVVINGIAENDDEKIVDQCCNFVDNIKTIKCLRKRREKLKAKLSTIISILYPDRATDNLVELFTNIDWSQTKSVNQAFMKLLEL